MIDSETTNNKPSKQIYKFERSACTSRGIFILLLIIFIVIILIKYFFF